MAEVKILWIYRRSGRGGTEEGERTLSLLVSQGWRIVSTSTTNTKDDVPVLCVVVQKDD